MIGTIRAAGFSSLLPGRSLAEARDESVPEAVAAKGQKGVFGKLSEWFS